MILSIQWLHSLGEFSQNYQSMELMFKSIGRDIAFNGIYEDSPQTVTPKKMERIFCK